MFSFKSLLYKIGKGAVTGALAAFATLSMAGVPISLGKEAIGAVVSGAIHGITNAIEQKNA